MSARKATGSRVGLPRFPRRKLTCRSRRRCAGADGSTLGDALGRADPSSDVLNERKVAMVTGASRNMTRLTAVASFLLLLSAVLTPTGALSSGWPTSGTPPAPNDPDYQPVETGFPSSCSSQSVDDEQLYFYGFMLKCGPQAMDPENASACPSRPPGTTSARARSERPTW